MNKLLFFVISLLAFFACQQKKKDYYIDLGNEKMKVFTVPDSIKSFAFYDLDNSKIVLEVEDTSHIKLLLDTKNGMITTLDLASKNFKGIYHNHYAKDTLRQRFWQAKNGELEMYDAKQDTFFYFQSTTFGDVIFTNKYSVFATREGLKIFDNQSLRLDSVVNIPPWNYIIESENDNSIYINSDHRFNLNTRVLEPLTREQTRERVSACFMSESKERRKKEERSNPYAWDYSIVRQEGVLTHFQDRKNIYVLFKGKIIIVNKAFWKKEDEYKWLEKGNTIDSTKEKYNNEGEVNYEEIDIDAFFTLNTKRVSQNLNFSDRKLAYFKVWNKRFPNKIDTISNKGKYYKAIRLQKTYDSLLLKNATNDVILYHKIELVKQYYYLINTYHFEPTYEAIRVYEWNTSQKILKQYPNSIYADDIELAIFNNEIIKNKEDEYNRTFSKRDITRLKKIIAKYPNSNLKKEFELAMINTYRCMSVGDAVNAADSIKIFNYQLKGAEMLVDFYDKNPNFYKCSENEYEENCETKQRLIFAKQDLESIKFQQNIRVSLSCSQKEYNRKEPIILTYTIKNVGQEEQEIETNEIDGLAYKCLLFNVLNYPTEGCALDSVVYFQRILKETPKPTKQILKVGEVVNFQIDITKLANLRAKEFSEFENPLKYCRYPNSYGRLEFLKPQTLEIYIDRYRLTSSNKLLIKIK